MNVRIFEAPFPAHIPFVKVTRPGDADTVVLLFRADLDHAGRVHAVRSVLGGNVAARAVELLDAKEAGQ
ncbi:hypothetical protein HDA32_005372 [Spinactinospora alkalitolerans]|uniref:Uncharacterized protein n=1 Tax=Spinactinospora alkalitolerans TaxID=687207 RepID=A0A852U445_9ACTN|nr:hypothetical protein [Spinactinospora alkalitolerans]NYE50252.1 hypothetical protein [Spinactinospora alkalitolerans]